MAIIFTANICWNIFDHADQPEPLWKLLEDGHFAEARREARRLIRRHPKIMLPVIASCLRDAG